MKFCKDCKHSIHKGGFISRRIGTDQWFCANPNVVDLVSGEPVNAHLLRTAIGKCTPAGKYFEPKDAVRV